MHLWSVCVYMLESVVALSVHVCSFAVYILYEVVSTVRLCHMHSSPPCCVGGSWVSSGLLYSGSLYNANPLLVANRQHPGPYLDMACKQHVYTCSVNW